LQTERDAAPLRPLRSAAVYAGANAGQRLLTFLLLPAVTRAMTPSEYGSLSLALAINAVAIIVFAAGLDIAIFRNLFSLADDPLARTQFIRSIWTFLLVVPLVAAAVGGVIAIPLLGTDGPLSGLTLALSLAAAALYVGATTVPFAVLRSEERLRDFLRLNAVAAVTSTALIVILVIGLDLAENGWMAAAAASAAVTCLVSCRLVPYASPRPFARPAVKAALRESISVLPHFLSMWGLQLADRLLLVTLVSTSAVGLYSLAGNLALPLLVLVQALNQGFMPAFARAPVLDGPATLGAQITQQITVVIGLTVACLLVMPATVDVLFDARYSKAAELVPWLVLGYGFLGLYGIPMNLVTLTAGRTRRIWTVSLFAAVVNLGLVLVLVPHHGIKAAAVAAALGYMALFVGVLTYQAASGLRPTYPLARMAIPLAAGAGIYLAGVASAAGSGLGNLILRVAWGVVALIVCACLASPAAANMITRAGSAVRTCRRPQRNG
jgi:O-antigen/teichoic acid export membrane protein